MAAPSCDSLPKIVHGIPGYDPVATAGGEFVFDETEAASRILFFEDHLTHTKGAKANKPFALEDWQKSIIANLFGWKHKDTGLRRYREGFIFVPRKNGKSLLAAGIGNSVLFQDGEPGGEIYVAAADRDQAKIIFAMAKGQVLQSKILTEASEVFAKSIHLPTMGGFFQPVSSDANTKHGYDAHCVIVDELHAHRDRELVDVLLTSTGARRQPLVIHVTTSDFERPGSICNEKHEYASKVRDGIIEDPSFLPVIYEAKLEDDWTSPEVWERANPCLGVAVSREYFERECKRAQALPTFENTFKRLHLNIRTEQAERWIQMDRWDACAGEVDREALRGRPCYAGLDLANTTDITALVLFFPDDENAVLPFFWVPGDSATLREKRDNVPYSAWARKGLLEMTNGRATDYEVVRAKLNALASEFVVREVAFDPWNAMQLAQELGDQDGFDMVEFRQGFASMNAPSKALDALIAEGDLRHGGHEVLRWMASNVAKKEDPAGNIKVDKQKSSEKVDGIVALVMAIGRALVSYDSTSVYEERGFLEW